MIICFNSNIINIFKIHRYKFSHHRSPSLPSTNLKSIWLIYSVILVISIFTIISSISTSRILLPESCLRDSLSGECLWGNIEVCLFTASRIKSWSSIYTVILSVTSNPFSLRIFWILFTNSRAMPSYRKSSDIVISRATVSLPSLATCQPECLQKLSQHLQL